MQWLSSLVSSSGLWFGGRFRRMASVAAIALDRLVRIAPRRRLFFGVWPIAFEGRAVFERWYLHLRLGRVRPPALCSGCTSGHCRQRDQKSFMHGSLNVNM